MIAADTSALMVILLDEPEAEARMTAIECADSARWGKGIHPAALNYGDCFSYEVATAHRCSLLYVGKDFARTDVRSALEGA